MDKSLEEVIEAALHECPILRPMETLAYPQNEFTELKKSVDSYHQAQNKILKTGQDEFQHNIKTMETNLFSFQSMVEDDNILKSSGNVILDTFLGNPTIKPPAYFDDIFQEEFEKYSDILQQDIKQTYQKIINKEFNQNRDRLIQVISNLFKNISQNPGPQALMHQLHLIQESCQMLQQHESKFEQFTHDIIRKIYHFTFLLHQNVTQLENNCQLIRDSFFQDKEDLKRQLAILPSLNPHDILTERYNIQLRNSDLRGLSIPNIEVSKQVQTFVMAYLNERNSSYDQNSNIYVLPYDFMEKLAPQLNEQKLNYDKVRNMTQTFMGKQNIFSKFQEILLTVPLYQEQQILVLIKNFPLQQIYIYDNKILESSHEKLRNKIVQILKGYIYFEYLDKSMATSNEAMTFADQYVALTSLIEPFPRFNIRIQYIQKIKVLADGIPFDEENMTEEENKNFKFLLFVLIKEVGNLKGKLSFEHVF